MKYFIESNEGQIYEVIHLKTPHGNVAHVSDFLGDDYPTFKSFFKACKDFARTFKYSDPTYLTDHKFVTVDVYFIPWCDIRQVWEEENV